MQIEITTELIAWLGFIIAIINSLAVIWTIRWRNERFRAIIELNFKLIQTIPDIQNMILTVSNVGGRSAKIEQILVFMLPFLDAPISPQPVQDRVLAGQAFKQTISLPVPKQEYLLRVVVFFKESRFQRKFNISKIEVHRTNISTSSKTE